MAPAPNINNLSVLPMDIPAGIYIILFPIPRVDHPEPGFLPGFARPCNEDCAHPQRQSTIAEIMAPILQRMIDARQEGNAYLIHWAPWGAQDAPRDHACVLGPYGNDDRLRRLHGILVDLEIDFKANGFFHYQPRTGDGFEQGLPAPLHRFLTDYRERTGRDFHQPPP